MLGLTLHGIVPPVLGRGALAAERAHSSTLKFKRLCTTGCHQPNHETGSGGGDRDRMAELKAASDLPAREK